MFSPSFFIFIYQDAVTGQGYNMTKTWNNAKGKRNPNKRYAVLRVNIVRSCKSLELSEISLRSHDIDSSTNKYMYIHNGKITKLLLQ